MKTQKNTENIRKFLFYCTHFIIIWTNKKNNDILYKTQKHKKIMRIFVRFDFITCTLIYMGQYKYKYNLVFGLKIKFYKMIHLKNCS